MATLDHTPETTPDDRGRWARTPLWARIVGGVFLAIFLVWLVLFITKGRFLKSTFVKYASSYMERPVTVGGDFNLYFNPLDVQFLAEDMTVANPAWTKGGQLFQSKHIDFRLSTWRLILGKKVFNSLNIDRGDIALQTDGKGHNNWSFNSTEPFVLPTIRRAMVTGTVLTYVDPLNQLDIHLKFGDVGAAGRTIEGPITLSGGGTARKVPFTLTGKLSSPNETLAGGRNQFEMHAGVADSRIDVSGTLPGATQFEGADLRIQAKGHNLATPFRLLGMAVPESRPYRIASNLTKTSDEWKFTRLTGKFGESDIAGAMTMSQPDKRIRLVADLKSRNLDILDVGPWIGYSPEKLDAQGGKGAITVKGGHPTILPDAPLDISGLKAFDADVKYHATNIRTGTIPIQNLDLGLGLDNLLLSLKPLSFDLAGGRLSSDISINARKAPVVTEYDIRLSPVALNKLLTGFKIEDSGTTGTVRGRIQLKGYGDTVRKSLGSSTGRIAVILPRGTFWIRNTELLELDLFQYVGKALAKQLKDPSQVRCGLFGFTVRNGVAVADPIFIDTQRTVIRGTGSFSFADESLDLSVRADAKKFSLFSGQSPIGVGGWFAAPSINPISHQLLTRGAVGVGLGILGGPLAAILAFVDTGDQKNTDCTPVLAGATTPAVRAADEAAEKSGGVKTAADKKFEADEEARKEQRKAAKKAEKAREKAADKARDAAEDAAKERAKAAKKAAEGK